jgi:hypothetical protein
MMVLPDLRGKSKEQIMTAIRGIKQDIGRLKNIMENPDYKPIVEPNEDARIQCYRQSLEMAKLAYTEAGGIYTLSKSEEKAADFDENINAIKKIILNISSHFIGSRSYVVELSDDIKAYLKSWQNNEEPLILLDYRNEPFTKDTFIAALKEFHIGEWRREYSIMHHGLVACDGTSWKLEIEYNNGHRPIRSTGYILYPYNFEKFMMLFNISFSKIYNED